MIKAFDLNQLIFSFMLIKKWNENLVILNIKLLIFIEIFKAGEDNSPQNIVVYIFPISCRFIR